MVLVCVQGGLSFAVGSTVISQVMYVTPDAPTLAGSFATASFNVGAALGPWLGGMAIAAGFGARAPLWVSAVMVGVAWGFALLVLGVRRVVLGVRRVRGGRRGRGAVVG